VTKNNPYQTTIKGESVGEARLDYYCAYTQDGYSRYYDFYYTVKVTAGPEGYVVTIEPEDVSLDPWTTCTIKSVHYGLLGGTYFESEDNSIAKIISTSEVKGLNQTTTTGTIRGINPGVTYIYAKNHAGGISSPCRVLVNYRNGDTFTYEYEGKTLEYKVLNSVTKTCEVTIQSSEDLNGTIKIPSEALGYTVTTIGQFAFSRTNNRISSVEIPTSITSIENSAFEGCTNLSYVYIPSSVVSIGMNAFYGCHSLYSLNLPSSITAISRGTFTNCESLTSFTFPYRLSNISDEAFKGCSGLRSIEITPYVKVVANNAFSYCALERISVSSSNSYYDSRQNCNAIIEKSSNKLVVGCKNTVIPEDVKKVGGQAFMGCIGLREITLPESLEGIESEAFMDCNDLVMVTSLAKKPLTISSNTFSTSTYNYAILKVPYGKKSLYASSTGWKSFKNIVELERESIPGDVNKDNEITPQDASLVLQVLAGKISKDRDEIDWGAADVNGVDDVTPLDVTYILKLAEKESNSK